MRLSLNGSPPHPPSQPPLAHSPPPVPAGSPSRGGDVAVNVFDINQPSLPTPFHSVLVSVSVFMALSTVFHSVKILPTTLCFLTLFIRTGPFNSISLYESLPQP